MKRPRRPAPPTPVAPTSVSGPTAARASAFGTEVTPVELFFDLVFVFAISQLSHHLLEHLTPTGVGETAVLLVAVFGIWSSTSFGASLPGVGARAETVSILAAMFLVLLMNAGAEEAFGAQPWLFLVPYLVFQVARAVVPLTTGATGALREHYLISGCWYLATIPLWLLGAAGQEDRLWWWGAAALVDVVGNWSAHRLPGHRFATGDVPVSAEHMLERSRLFLLVALGETIVTTGATIAADNTEPASLLAGTLALVITIGLWAFYFAGSDRLVREHAETTSDTLQAARLAVNSQMVVLAGLITLAVANEIAITEPQQSADVGLVALLFGGPALYVAAQAGYLWLLTGALPAARLATVGSLLAVAAVTAVLDITALGALGVLAVLVTTAAALTTRPTTRPTTAPHTAATPTGLPPTAPTTTASGTAAPVSAHEQKDNL